MQIWIFHFRNLHLEREKMILVFNDISVIEYASPYIVCNYFTKKTVLVIKYFICGDRIFPAKYSRKKWISEKWVVYFFIWMLNDVTKYFNNIKTIFTLYKERNLKLLIFIFMMIEVISTWNIYNCQSDMLIH